MDDRIVDLRAAGAAAYEQAAELLVTEFAEQYPDAWPTIESARQEVEECLAPDYLARGAVGDDGALVGWIGGRPSYRGRVWELHPLVVRQDHQGMGIGSTLVRGLERLVLAVGAHTLWVGVDDTDDRTSLSGVDLYEDLPGKLAAFENHGGHQIAFYQRFGFVLTGVMPDSGGVGKPDIFLAKRIGR